MDESRNHSSIGVAFGGYERGAGCGCVGRAERSGCEMFVTWYGVANWLGFLCVQLRLEKGEVRSTRNLHCDPWMRFPAG